MNRGGTLKSQSMSAFALAALLGAVVVPVSAADGQLVAHNTPRYVSAAAYVKPEDPTNVIDVTIWLNPHNRDQMDALARDLYDPHSPNYRHWLTRAQIAAQFAPTAEEAATVSKFFEAQHLQVVLVGEGNYFVRARGTVADVQKAFHVQLNDYQVHGALVRANAGDPQVAGSAAPLVRAVAGLDAGVYTHPLMVRPSTQIIGKAAASSAGGAAATSAAGAAQASFYTSNCFSSGTQTFSTNNDGELPIGTYSGTRLNLETLTSPGCGYTPAPIQRAYLLNKLYAKGYNGKGQTIVIIDWCGSSTVESDANAFSKKFNLPQLDSSNFQIIYTPTPSQCIEEDQVEINLDVEWAHAIAPGANIALVVPPAATLQDVDEAEFYAVNYGLGNSISGSYGSAEAETPQSYLETENLISEIAALSGISTNFASGDAGDFTSEGLPATVNAPADAPWATGVGGISLALNADDGIAWQVGWGNNVVTVAGNGSIIDPPVSGSEGFYGGAGGGPSTCASQDYDATTGVITCVGGYPKPAFQSKLPGKVRRVPDVAWLADPFTGVVIAITVPGQTPAQIWEVIGGTSVATPMFSALWAIANQEAGEPLGQAAQYLYSMPADTLTDIVPLAGANNVKVTIEEPGKTEHYTPAMVLGTAAPGDFLSAWVDYPYGYLGLQVISFETDCSALPASSGNGTSCTSPTALHTATGWDDVTGVGTPNALAFADYFNPGANAVK
jgi:subtilase family serine protease